MSEQATPAGLIGHYIQCAHTLTCARKDFGKVFEEPTEDTPSSLVAAAALDEAITTMAKLITSLAMGEMPRRTQVTS